MAAPLKNKKTLLFIDIPRPPSDSVQRMLEKITSDFSVYGIRLLGGLSRQQGRNGERTDSYVLQASFADIGALLSRTISAKDGLSFFLMAAKEGEENPSFYVGPADVSFPKACERMKAVITPGLFNALSCQIQQKHVSSPSPLSRGQAPAGIEGTRRSP